MSKTLNGGATTGRRTVRGIIAIMAFLGLVAMGTSPSAASEPEIIRTPVQTYFDPGFISCDGFAVDLTGSQYEVYMVFRDQSGDVVRVTHAGYVVETFTNTVSGASLTNRGVFRDTFTRVDGTEDFVHVVVGFDFIATSPGWGLVLQEVGRKVFSVDGERLVFFAGKSSFSEDAICASLA